MLKCFLNMFHETQEESHSGWTPKCTALWQRKRAHRCDSAGADSNVTTLIVTALEQQWQWQWQRWDNDVQINVTALSQHCQLPLLSQWCAHRCHINISEHWCHSAVNSHSYYTSVHSNVRALSLSFVSLHRWHTNVTAISETVLSWSIL